MQGGDCLTLISEMQKQLTFIKICGITRLSDARAVARSGANAVGFVFAKSPRRISPRTAQRIASHLHPSVRRIGVFVDSNLKHILDVVRFVGLDGVQLQGFELPAAVEALKAQRPELFVLKVVRVEGRHGLAEAKEFVADKVLFDRKDPMRPDLDAGRVPLSWLRAKGLPSFVVAGGLDPFNVGKVLTAVRPWGVDVSSGVEIKPGKKDKDLIRAFVRAVRETDSTIR